MRMGQIDELAKKTNSKVISADATSLDDLQNLIEQSMEILGGKIDFVLHSIGMSINVRKGKAYTDQNYDWTHKGLDVSAMSFHRVMQTLYKNDAMNEWGSIVALSYMAAQRVFPDYNDMADNKAFLESSFPIATHTTTSNTRLIDTNDSVSYTHLTLPTKA